jgi:uncharacterized iron-regulated membrane protein
MCLPWTILAFVQVCVAVAMLGHALLAWWDRRRADRDPPPPGTPTNL